MFDGKECWPEQSQCNSGIFVVNQESEVGTFAGTRGVLAAGTALRLFRPTPLRSFMNWKSLFAEAQAIVRDATSVTDGVARSIDLAKRKPDEFGNAAEWEPLIAALDEGQIRRVIGWAETGIDQLAGGCDFDVLLLDLGDCPHMFELTKGRESTIDEERFRQTVLSKPLIEWHELSETVDNFHDMFHFVTLIERNLLYEDFAFCPHHFEESAGCLFWLVLGSLGLIEPFRDAKKCASMLKGRNKLYLLSGYEEIFMYLCSVTKKGIEFEETVDKQ
jgi:hypothetical protein